MDNDRDIVSGVELLPHCDLSQAGAVRLDSSVRLETDLTAASGGLSVNVETSQSTPDVSVDPVNGIHPGILAPVGARARRRARREMARQVEEKNRLLTLRDFIRKRDYRYTGNFSWGGRLGERDHILSPREIGELAPVDEIQMEQFVARVETLARKFNSSQSIDKCDLDVLNEVRDQMMRNSLYMMRRVKRLEHYPEPEYIDSEEPVCTGDGEVYVLSPSCALYCCSEDDLDASSYTVFAPGMFDYLWNELSDAGQIAINHLMSACHSGDVSSVLSFFMGYANEVRESMSWDSVFVDPNEQHDSIYVGRGMAMTSVLYFIAESVDLGLTDIALERLIQVLANPEFVRFVIACGTESKESFTSFLFSLGLIETVVIEGQESQIIDVPSAMGRAYHLWTAVKPLMCALRDHLLIFQICDDHDAVDKWAINVRNDLLKGGLSMQMPKLVRGAKQPMFAVFKPIYAQGAITNLAIKTVSDAWNWLLEKIKFVCGALSEFFGAFFDSLVAALKSVFDRVSSFALSVLIRSLPTWLVDYIKDSLLNKVGLAVMYVFMFALALLSAAGMLSYSAIMMFHRFVCPVSQAGNIVSNAEPLFSTDIVIDTIKLLIPITPARIRLLGQTLRSGQEIIRVGHSAWTWLMNALRQVCPAWLISILPDEEAEVLSWQQRALVALNLSKTPGSGSSQKYADFVAGLLKEWNTKICAMCKKSTGQNRSCLGMVGPLNAINGMVRAVRAGNLSRAQPVCYWFFGPPGCGKTKTMNSIWNTLCVPTLNDSDPHRPTVYNHCFSDDGFWNSYRQGNDDIMVFDEVGAIADPMIQIRFFSSILSVVSGSTYCPNLATVDPSSLTSPKGTSICPTCVALGSNSIDIPAEIETEAIARRVFRAILPMVPRSELFGGPVEAMNVECNGVGQVMYDFDMDHTFDYDGQKCALKFTRKPFNGGYCSLWSIKPSSTKGKFEYGSMLVENFQPTDEQYLRSVMCVVYDLRWYNSSLVLQYQYGKQNGLTVRDLIGNSMERVFDMGSMMRRAGQMVEAYDFDKEFALAMSELVNPLESQGKTRKSEKVVAVASEKVNNFDEGTTEGVGQSSYDSCSESDPLVCVTPELVDVGALDNMHCWSLPFKTTLWCDGLKPDYNVPDCNPEMFPDFQFTGNEASWKVPGAIVKLGWDNPKLGLSPNVSFGNWFVRSKNLNIKLHSSNVFSTHSVINDHMTIPTCSIDDPSWRFCDLEKCELRSPVMRYIVYLYYVDPNLRLRFNSSTNQYAVSDGVKWVTVHPDHSTLKMSMSARTPMFQKMVTEDWQIPPLYMYPSYGVHPRKDENSVTVCTRCLAVYRAVPLSNGHCRLCDASQKHVSYVSNSFFLNYLELMRVCYGHSSLFLARGIPYLLETALSIKQPCWMPYVAVLAGSMVDSVGVRTVTCGREIYGYEVKFDDATNDVAHIFTASALIIGSMIGVGVAIWKLFAPDAPTVEAIAQGGNYDSSDSTDQYRQDSSRSPSPQSRPRKGRSHSPSEERDMYYDVFDPMWSQGLARDVVVRFEADGVACYGLRIHNNVLVTFGHCFPKTKKKLHIVYGDVVFDLEEDECVFDEAYDLIAFLLPRQVSPVRNRTSLLLSKGEYSSLSRMTVCRTNGVDVYSSPGRMVCNRSYNVAGSDDAISLAIGVTYDGVTEGGDCGTGVFVNSGFYTGRLLGLHVAGTGVATRPYGLGTLITKEWFESTCKLLDVDVKIKGAKDGVKLVSQGLFDEVMSMHLDRKPNVEYVEMVPPREVLHCPRSSKLKPSLLLDDNDLPHTQRPANLRKNPDIDGGVDPAARALEELATVDPPPIDESILPALQGDLIAEMEKYDVAFPYRELTYDEAVAGVPGFINALNVDSSAGIPHIYQYRARGRRELVWTKDGSYYTDEAFKQEVMALYKAFKEGDEEYINTYDFKWMAFLKDEYRKNEKVQQNKTRLIFANNVAFAVVFRMMFGCLYGQWNHLANQSLFSIGMNINSFDAQGLFEYLTERGYTKMIAGDYSSFDKNYHPVVQKYSYGVIEHFASKIPGFSRVAWDLFVKHELCPLVQIEDVLVRFKHAHFSGCFFTTHENCIQNQLYFMWVFKQMYPGLNFFKHCRGAFLGDDHIIAVDDNVPEFNSITVYDKMKLLGQKYTNEDKSIPTIPYKTFEECSYLGSSFVKYRGLYVGALRETTIFSHLDYIKSSLSVESTIDQFLDLLSIHSKSDFDWFCDILEKYYVIERNYAGRRDRQAQTCAVYQQLISQSELGTAAIDYYMGNAADDTAPMPSFEGNDEVMEKIDQLSSAGTVTKPKDETKLHYSNEQAAPAAPLLKVPVRAQEPRVENLNRGPRVREEPHLSVSKGGEVMTKQQVVNDLQVEEVPRSFSVNLIPRTMNAGPGTLTMGARADSYLTEFSWTMTQTADSDIWSMDMPGEALITLGNSLTTLPFRTFTYWHGGIDLTFELNTTPFMTGLLAVYFMPLEVNAAPYKDCLTVQHVLLSANEGGSATLHIPYRWYYPVMHTENIASSIGMGLGYVHCKVVSPLLGPTGSTVTVSVFVKFTESNFYVPRIQYSFPSKKAKTKAEIDAVEKEPQLVAQGYLSAAAGILDTAGAIAGVVGEEEAEQQASKYSSLLSFLAEFIPFDHAPVDGGSEPISYQFPSMSNTRGRHFEQSLQLDPAVMSTEMRSIFDPVETKIDWLCAREQIVGLYTWTPTNTVGSNLALIPLNVCLGSKSKTTGQPVSVPSAVLLHFMYWHADVEFTIRVIKSQYQSGRLRAYVNYADVGWQYPYPGTTRGDKINEPASIANNNDLYNQVLDFSQRQSVVKILVPWNFDREFMATCASPTTELPRFGTFALNVQNRLSSSSAVGSTDVRVLVTARFLNVRVAVPIPVPQVSSASDIVEWYVRPATSTKEVLVAQGRDVDSKLVTVSPEVVPMSRTTADNSQATHQVYNHSDAAHFGHVVTDVMELARRMRRSTITVSVNKQAIIPGFSSAQSAVIRPVEFVRFPLQECFAAYGGRVRMRIILENGLYYGFTPEGWGGSTMNTVTDVTPAIIFGTAQGYQIERPSYLPVCSAPMEMFHPLPGGEGEWCFAEFSIPYQRMQFFNNRYDMQQSESVWVMSTRTNRTPGCTLTYAAGDDYLMGIYRPPQYTYRWAAPTSGTATGNVSVSGYTIPHN
ncbi:polyprotein [Rasavirus sp.]|nr:polyprotein [Rasavirus sp.]